MLESRVHVLSVPHGVQQVAAILVIDCDTMKSLCSSS